MAPGPLRFASRLLMALLLLLLLRIHPNRQQQRTAAAALLLLQPLGTRMMLLPRETEAERHTALPLQQEPAAAVKGTEEETPCGLLGAFLAPLLRRVGDNPSPWGSPSDDPRRISGAAAHAVLQQMQQQQQEQLERQPSSSKQQGLAAGSR